MRGHPIVIMGILMEIQPKNSLWWAKCISKTTIVKWCQIFYLVARSLVSGILKIMKKKVVQWENPVARSMHRSCWILAISTA